MLIDVTAPDGRKGVVDCQDDGGLTIQSGDFTKDDMANDLSSVTPFSPEGLVNTVNADYSFVLRSLVVVGWQIAWPEVAGDDGNEPETDGPTEQQEDTVVN